ncbi:MAG: M1 family aminopeptidase [Bryobacteraceae bacterium]
MLRACLPLTLALVFAASAPGSTGSELIERINSVELDREECYRVRDLSIIKEDLRIYLTDGVLIFTKPIGGVRTTAVFVADVDGGDAEVLVLPPTKGERQSMANYTGAPNLNEHFQSAVFVFTDDTYENLTRQLRESDKVKKSPEMALLLAPAWQSVVRNLAASFASRLALDLLSTRRQSLGLFFAAVAGRKLGNFDLVLDPRAAQQIAIGQTSSRENRVWFDTWTSFESRSMRNQSRPSAEFKLKDFRINATLQPPDLEMQAVARVKMVPSAAERVFPFDITGHLRVTAATIDSEPAEILARESLRSNVIRNTGNDLFLLISPRPLEAGREYEVEIRYEGPVVLNVGNRVFAVRSRGNWYPSRLPQRAHFELTFRYPKDLDLVASGDVVSDQTEGEWRTTTRKTNTEVRLVGFNLGEFEKASVSRGGYTVEVYANRTVERALQPRPPRDPLPSSLPEWPPRMGRRPSLQTSIPPPAEAPQPAPNPLARLQELAVEVASAMEFMSARFGPPPQKLLTVTPIPGAFGQGFPGLIYLSTLSYLGARDRPVVAMGERQRKFFNELLHTHEAAHQWWGNVVTSKSYQDDWILEALASYSSLLYLEKRKGLRALEEALGDYRDDLLIKTEDEKTVEATGPLAMGTRLFHPENARAWRTITYGKGTWVLHMLRRRMGDEAFDKMLGEFRRRFEGAGASSEDLRLTASQFLPEKSPDSKLEAFFDQWVYSTGIPSFQMTHSVRGKAPALRLTASVTQSDVDDEFSALVPIEIQFGRAKPIIHWVRTSSEPAAFSLTLKQAPTKVVLNPGAAVLTRK